MANLFQPSLNRVTDSNGNPVSGAKMYFYLTGTSTPAVWFTDQAGTVEGANPLTADSAGLFAEAYIDPDTTYRIKLTDSTGATTFWDVDPVRGYDIGAVQTAADAALASATAAATSATASGISATAAATSATTASGFADDAEGSATAAAASAAAAAISETAALVNGRVYADTAAGVAAVADGESFAVPDGNGNLDFYTDVAGVATALNVTLAGAAKVDAAVAGLNDYRLTNLFNYTSDDDPTPTLVNGWMQVLETRDRDTGELSGPAVVLRDNRTYEYPAQSITGVTDTLANRAASTVVVASCFGQSNSIVGGYHGPVISTEATYGSKIKTFAGGPHWFADTELDDISGGEDAIVNAVSVQRETPAIGIAEGLIEYARDNGHSTGNLTFFAIAAGKGGKTLESLTGISGTGDAPAGEWWTGWLDQITRAKAYADSLGADCVMPAWTWIQGESDQDAATSKALYKEQMLELWTQADAAIRAILTDQTEPVQMLISQRSTKSDLDSHSGFVTQAVWELAREHPAKFHLACAHYHQGEDLLLDGAHASSVGHKLEGLRCGYAMGAIGFDAVRPHTLDIVSADYALTSRGYRVRTRWTNHGALRFDLSYLEKVTDYGFRIRDDTGVLTISGQPEYVGENILDFYVNRALGANPLFQCAMAVLAANQGMTKRANIDGGASCNLVDGSEREHILTGGGVKRLPTLAQHFSIAIGA